MLMLLEFVFALLGLSWLAQIFCKKILLSCWLGFSLKTMPLFCAAMGLLYIAVGELLPETYHFALFNIAFCIVLLGFLLYWLAADKNNIGVFGALLGFAVGFVVSYCTVFAVFLLNLLASTLYYSNVALSQYDGCKMQFKRAFAMCPEYDRRIKFKSGKIVGIFPDTCRQSNFAVYKLKNGWLYLKCTGGIGNSFFIDTKNERVYDVFCNTYAELRGKNTVNGRMGFADANEIEYDIYCGKNYNMGSYKSKVLPSGDIMENARYLGELTPAGFVCKNPKRKR